MRRHISHITSLSVLLKDLFLADSTVFGLHNICRDDWLEKHKFIETEKKKSDNFAHCIVHQCLFKQFFFILI